MHFTGRTTSPGLVSASRTSVLEHRTQLALLEPSGIPRITKPTPSVPELLRFWQVREELTRGLNQRAVARAVKLAFGPPTPAAATALPPPEQMRQGQPSADSLAGYLAS